MEITITKDNFENEVLKSDKPVLVDFFATWCGPCKALMPTVDEIANEHPEIKVGKIDVDEEMELARQYKVFSVPTLIAFKDGNVLKQMVGVQTKEQILAAFA
jgi:thioredoxin 1